MSKRKKIRASQAQQPRNDSAIWSRSLQMGWNDSTSRSSYKETLLQHSYLDLIYENSLIMRRICEMIPFFATKEGVDIKTGNADLDAQIEDYIEEESLLDIVESSCAQARVHGGSALWLFNAGSNESGGDYSAIIELSCQELTQSSGQVVQDPVSPDFGYPSVWSVTPSESSQQYPVSSERIIRFEGVSVPRRRASQYNYFGKSYLEMIYENCLKVESSFEHVNKILSKYITGVLKRSNIQAMLSGNNSESLTGRLRYMSLTENNSSTVAIDKESEDYQRLSLSVSGIDQLFEQGIKSLVLMTGIPRTLLLGESPSGLQASGSSEMKHFNDLVRSYQKKVIKPALMRLLEPKFDADIKIEFRPIDRPSIKEMSEAYERNAKADQVYIESGVLLPERVTEKRFGNDEYSHEITLNEQEVNEAAGALDESEENNEIPE